MRLITYIIQLLRDFRRRRHYSSIKYVERVSDLPEKLRNNIYLVRRNGDLLWVVMDCPCRKNHRITINLMSAREPHWTVKFQGKEVTLFPSLWFKGECESHFWVKRNEVHWV